MANLTDKLVHVSTREELDKFYKESAFTLEGLSTAEGSLKEYVKWMKGYGVDTTNLVLHEIKGSLMNKEYGLRGNNRYPADCSIVVATGIDISKLIFPRFEIGARWFDDIVDNNKRHNR